MSKNTEEIREAVRKAAADGKLSCTRARRLAEELGVSPKEVGRAADDLKIKIYACELGCF